MSRVLDGGKPATQTRLRAGLSFAYAYGDQPYGGKAEVPNYDHFQLRLQLMTLLLGIDLPSGLGAGLVFPTGRLRIQSDVKNTDDTGIGDLELRVKQDLSQLLGLQGRYLPRLILSLGVAAPTGPYISKLQIAALQPGEILDKNLSLGRGVWWMLGDLDLYGQLFSPVGWFASLRTRTPLSEAEDRFQWGEEIQGGGGLSAAIWPKRVSMSASVDYLWRQMPTEIDYFGERVDSASIGGKYMDLTVSVRGQLSPNLAVDLTGRKPLWRDVYGLQTPPSYWVFAGLSWNMMWGDPVKVAQPVLRPAQPGDAPQPEVSAKLQPGKLALVDYWATWCPPCLKLSAELEEFAKSHPDLQLIKLDATDWDQAQMDRLLPAVPGLPVVDVYGQDGKLIQRLAGADAFGYARALPADSSPVAD